MRDYKGLLKKLLPTGPAWEKSEGTTLDATLQGLSDELGRADATIENLLLESDPRTATVSLSDWEELVGLPDACSVGAQTLQERRNAVVAKIAGRGGQSAQYFIDVAESLGYTISIEEPFPWRFGDSFGEPLRGDSWIHWFIVNASEFEVKYFRFGSSTFGEPFSFWGSTELECRLNQIKPAHTNILFIYD